MPAKSGKRANQAAKVHFYWRVNKRKTKFNKTVTYLRLNNSIASFSWHRLLYHFLDILFHGNC